MPVLLKSRFRRELKPAEPIVELFIQTPVLERTLKPVKIPKLLEVYWSQYPRPPFMWSSLGAYLRMQMCIEPIEPMGAKIVHTWEDWHNTPHSILRPDPAQIEKL